MANKEAGIMTYVELWTELIKEKAHVTQLKSYIAGLTASVGALKATLVKVKK